MAEDTTKAPPPTLGEAVARVCAECAECGACVAECAFLSARGTPKALAEGCENPTPERLLAAYECSLCGLCTQVCGYGVKPDALFAAMRREAVAWGLAPLPSHAKLLRFEKVGFSGLFSLFAFPKGCDTIFFPGCSLPGSRPGATQWAFARLRERCPSLGAVLHCCGKPGRDLGCEESFRERFSALRGKLEQARIRKVIVACPSCYRVFSECAPGIETVLVYGELSALAEAKTHGGRALMHDPCVARGLSSLHDSARALAAGAGVEIVEREECRGRTICCGEGGGVSHAAPKLAERWTERAAANESGLPIVTYCAGCANYLGARAKTAHVLEVLENPEVLRRGANPSRGLMTYVNRLKIKAALARLLKA